MDNQKYQAALYCRVSREDEVRASSMSIESQKLKLVHYAQQNNMCVHQIYCDDGVSGTTFDRPALNSMMLDIVSRQVNCVIVKDLSRLGREYRQSGMLLEDFFPKYNTRFIAIDDGVDMNPSSMDNLSNNLMLVLNNVINEMYPMDISRKTRSALQAKAKSGQYVAAIAPYGYSKAPHNKNVLEINEEAARWVSYIFEEAAKGTSLTRIARKLHFLHVPTAYDLRNETACANWNVSTVWTILNNTSYLGTITYGKTQRVSYKNKQVIYKPSAEWCVTEHAHEAIVSQELFDAVHKMIHVRHQQHLGNSEHPFATKLFCSDCGSPLNFCLEPRKGNPSEGYYVCRANKKYGKTKCSRHYIRLSVLSNAVHNELLYLRSLADSNHMQIYRLIMSNQEIAQQRLKAPVQERITQIEQKLREMNEMFASAYRDKSTGVLTKKQFCVVKEHFEQERVQLTKQQQADFVYIRHLEQQSKGIDKFISELRSTNITVLDFATIDRLIDKVVIEDARIVMGQRNQLVSVYYKHIGCIGSIDAVVNKNP